MANFSPQLRKWYSCHSVWPPRLVGSTLGLVTLSIKLSSPNHEKCRDGYRGIFYCGSVNWHFAISNRIRSLNIELLDTHVVQSKRINIGS